VFALGDGLLARLRAGLDRLSVVRVVSGPGLRAIAETLVESGAEAENTSLAAYDDRALWTHALEGTDRLAVAALERFAMCLGSAAGDVALMHGPGPVVIAGGLGLRIGTRLGALGFHDRFCAKGRYRELMRSLPVKLITHPEPGLYGAAAAWLARQA
ncbi:MAG: glucokinase, partial [Pseudomonadota bacterium]